MISFALASNGYKLFLIRDVKQFMGHAVVQFIEGNSFTLLG